MYNPRLFLAMLWQQRLQFIVIFAFVMTGAVALIWSRPPRYEADALIAVDTRPLRSVQGASSPETVNFVTRTDSSTLLSEINLLGSRPLIDRLIVAAQLDRDADFASAPTLWARTLAAFIARLHAWGFALDTSPANPSAQAASLQEDLAKRVSKALKVEVPKGTTQIRVAFVSTDPARAAATVNTLVSLYLDDQVAAKQRVIGQTLAELRRKLEDFRQQAVTAGAVVQSFRDSHRLLKTTGPSPLTQQLTQVMLDEQKSRLEAQDADAKLKLLQALGPLSGETAAAMAPVLGYSRDLLSELASQQAALRAKLARSISTLGASHPEVAQTRAQLTQVNDRLDASYTLMLKVAADHAVALNGQHTRVAETLNAVRAELQRENAAEVQLEPLSDDARAKQAAYDEAYASYSRVLVQERAAVADLRVLYPAQPPTAPISSKLPLVMFSLLVAGLTAAASVLLMQRRTRSRRQTAREFEEWSDVPVIGICPTISAAPTSRARALNPANYLGRNPLSDYAEAMREVRNALDFDHKKITSIAVTSARQGEGKSTFAVSLAAAWAAAGTRTLLIDCDLRRPALPRMLPCNDGIGLTNFLAAQPGGVAIVQTNVALGFDFITAGSEISKASYRFTRSKMRALIDQFSSRYDRIILDLPPVLAVADGAVGAAASDITLLINHWGETKLEDSSSALELLRKIGVTEVRAVLCRVDRRHYSKLDRVSQYAYRHYPARDILRADA